MSKDQSMVHRKFTLLIEKHDEWYVGSCPEVIEANGQGKTMKACRQNLLEAIDLVLMDRQEEASSRDANTAVPVTVVLDGK